MLAKVLTVCVNTADHREGTASVRIVYHNYRPMKDGSFQFYVCITKHRKRRYIATGLTLHPDFWDEEKQRIRKSFPHEDRKKLQKSLDEWKRRYELAAETLAESDEAHDAGAVVAHGSQERNATRRIQLLAYIDELVQNMVVAKQVGNSIVYRDLRNQLAEFIGDKYEGATDVLFDKVTVSFCNNFETYLRARNNTENTLSNRFRTLRAVMNKAIASEYAKAEKYPFSRNPAERHKFSVGKFDTSTTKRAISRDDIRSIEAYVPTSERLILAKNVFLFSFYLGGINFVDLAQLRWRNITAVGNGDQRLSYIRQKTGGKFNLRLLGPALSILDEYRQTSDGQTDEYVFPILNTVRHQSPVQIKNRLHKKLGQINEDLKQIAKEAGLATIDLTTYVARHSFASGLKHAGVATALISQAMGHADERTTQIYLSEFETDIMDEAFKNLL